MPEEITRQEYEFVHRVLSGYPDVRYEFSREAERFCCALWRKSLGDLRISILRHLKENRPVFRKRVNHVVLGRQFFQANVELWKGMDVYVELSFDCRAFVRINAHPHRGFPVLER